MIAICQLTIKQIKSYYVLFVSHKVNYKKDKQK
jgi:hypothetical protein